MKNASFATQQVSDITVVSHPHSDNSESSILRSIAVSGGPFGIEPTIRAAGNFYAILGKYL
jgi:hypothetical protein